VCAGREEIGRAKPEEWNPVTRNEETGCPRLVTKLWPRMEICSRVDCLQSRAIYSLMQKQQSVRLAMSLKPDLTRKSGTCKESLWEHYTCAVRRRTQQRARLVRTTQPRERRARGRSSRSARGVKQGGCFSCSVEAQQPIPRHSTFAVCTTVRRFLVGCGVGE
jgi:hypothetical protein